MESKVEREEVEDVGLVDIVYRLGSGWESGSH